MESAEPDSFVAVAVKIWIDWSQSFWLGQAHKAM
jgi:hypothetical protein